MSALVQAGFQTLVDAGYQEELAYFECLHELKIIVDLLYRGGIKEMRKAISNTAEFGDYVSGPRVIDSSTRDRMKEILEEIQDGQFAKRFMDQHRKNDAELLKFRAQNSDLPIEEVGNKPRGMMPWLNEKE